MIKSKKDLKEYIERDAIANHRNTSKTNIVGDDLWKFQVYLRKCEYYHNARQKGKPYLLPFEMIWYYLYKKKSSKLNITIPLNIFGKGLSIAHSGCIVVSTNAKVGDNCRIHEGVTIGATNGEENAAIIGDNVFIASGAKIIGNIRIANDVGIGANAVVVKSIEEAGTTWGGVPAKKISCNNSHSNLEARLFEV